MAKSFRKSTTDESLAGTSDAGAMADAPRSRELLELWKRLKPAASKAEAARVALMMAGRVEHELADAVAKLALWRATQHSADEMLPRHLRDALAYSAFLDLILITDLKDMAQPQDLSTQDPPVHDLPAQDLPAQGVPGGRKRGRK
jgi:hypothetical protein